MKTAVGLQATKDAPPPSRNERPSSQSQGGMEVLTPTEGVDFGPYLHSMYVSVKKKWLANMPASVASGQRGRNSVQFRILRDGSIPKDYLNIVSSSGRNELDEASLRAVRDAAPFGRLPEKYSADYIELRFSFSYNLPQERQ